MMCYFYAVCDVLIIHLKLFRDIMHKTAIMQKPAL